VRIDGVAWCLLSKAEQESLIASGDYDAERCRYCDAFIEVWQRESADAAKDWQRVPPVALALFARNPADWRVIASWRGLRCAAGGDHAQRNGEPRAYATMIQMINANVGRRVVGGVPRG
jgi:hypothetical protein